MVLEASRRNFPVIRGFYLSIVPLYQALGPEQVFQLFILSHLSGFRLSRFYRALRFATEGYYYHFDELEKVQLLWTVCHVSSVQLL